MEATDQYGRNYNDNYISLSRLPFINPLIIRVGSLMARIESITRKRTPNTSENPPAITTAKEKSCRESRARSAANDYPACLSIPMIGHDVRNRRLHSRLKGVGLKHFYFG